MRRWPWLNRLDNRDRAAIWIRNGIEGVVRPRILDTETASVAYEIYEVLEVVARTVMTPGLMALAFFETRPDDRLPTNGAPFIEATRSIEAGLLLGLFVVAACARISLGSQSFWSSREHLLKVIAVAAALVFAIPRDFHLISRILRFGVYATHSVRIKAQIVMAWRILPMLARVGGLLLAACFFFSYAAVVIFSGSPESDYFPTFLDGSWQFFALSTTTNFPDVMLPAYNKNPLLAFTFFFLFLSIGYFGLFNLILALVYDGFTELRDQHFAQLQHNRKVCVHEAYNLLRGNGLLAQQEKERDVDGMIASLVQSCARHGIRITVPPRRRTTEPEAASAEKEFEDRMLRGIETAVIVGLTDAVRRPLRRGASVREVASEYLRTIVTSPAFEYTVDAVIVINAAFILVQTRRMLVGFEMNGPNYLGAETIFAFLYFVEMVTKMLALGVRRYFRSNRDRFDFTVTMAAVLAVLLSIGGVSSVRLVKVFVVARGLRLLRLLELSSDARLVADSVTNMLPVLFEPMRFALCFVYLAAAVGCALFHGSIRHDAPQLQGTDYARLGYYNLNFNDMPSAAVLVFTIMVANNWLILAEGFAAVAGPLARLYFLAVYAVGVLLFVNVITAFVIDSLITELRHRKRPSFEVSPSLEEDAHPEQQQP